MSDRIRILILTGGYLPGYKAGGPIRSISSMVESLGDEFEFRILTLDRDLHETRPYPGIVSGAWMPVGKAQVMYLPPEQVRLGSLRRLIRETPHDVVYLGGGFDPTFVLRALVLRRLGLVEMPSVMLAPQGIFSKGALQIKSWKKWPFLALARQLGLYDGLTWHVSTMFEKNDVRAALRLHGKRHFVVVAPDIATVSTEPPPARRKSPGRLQVMFLSRICAMKNLDGALRILQGVDATIDFHIYGPAEDKSYWRACEAEMRKLPANVSATYHGPIAHSDVAAAMRAHDLFFLPTRGENFGHVIIEALREGCPALIANTTAFRNLESQCAGWDLPLDDVQGFRRVLQECAAMPPDQWLRWSEGARRLVATITADGRITKTYRAAFRKLMARHNTARAA
jgi:glycosyltransferase involved in cell wall biosynthesis